MSKPLIKKVSSLNYEKTKILDLDTDEISFENLSLENNIFDKDINLKKIDFIEEKNDDHHEIKSILSDLDKNIEINVKDSEKGDNYDKCQEILNILRKHLSDKNIRFYISPFKPLLKPRKISMEGKILYNDPKFVDNNVNSLDTQNSSNCSNIKNIKNN